MAIKSPEQNKKLKDAMRQNIARRKESLSKKSGTSNVLVQEETQALMDKINKIESFRGEQIQEKKSSIINQTLVLTVIIDLLAGGIAGAIIGFGVAKLLGTTSNLPIILCFVFGIMGGFYNVAKQR